MRSIVFLTGMSRSVLRSYGALIEEFSIHGFSVDILAPDLDAKTARSIQELGANSVPISLDRTGTTPLRDALDLIRLYRWLRFRRPEIVLCMSVKPVVYGIIAAWMARVPRRFGLIAGLGYVFTPPLKGDIGSRRLLRLLITAMYRLALPRCERVFFQNAEDLKSFVGNGLLPRLRAVLTAGSGVDLNAYSPAALPDGPITFLLMARLLREKGICEYVAAARLLKTKGCDVQFLLLGDVDTNPGSLMRKDVEGWAREGILEWPGEVADVRPWIARSHVYVLPSYYREGVPRSTQEAMAMARPVITTDAVGCRDTVVDGVNGFLVPVRDVEALAAAMRRFIENPELIERMGRESRRLAEERFDVHKINAVMLEAMGLGAPRASGQVSDRGASRQGQQGVGG